MNSRTSLTLLVVLLGCAVVNAVDDRLIPDNLRWSQNSAGAYVYADCGGFPGHGVFVAGGKNANPPVYIKYQVDDYCSRCPPGSYAPTYWMWECIATPPGFYNNFIGANITYPCPAGSKCAGGRAEAVQCMDGMFQKYPGQSECLPCPNGLYSTYAGDGCATYAPDAPVNCTATNCTFYQPPHPWAPSNWTPKSSNSSTSVWPNQTAPANAGIPPCIFDCPVTASPSGSSSGSSGSSNNNNGNTGSTGSTGGSNGDNTGTSGGVNSIPTGSGTVTKGSPASSLSSSLVVAFGSALAFMALTPF